MICLKASNTLPLCSCIECNEDRLATMRRIFTAGIEMGQDEYQRDWTEADRDQWGNQEVKTGGTSL